MRHNDLSFHNVAELPDRDHSGHVIQRVPEPTRVALNEGAQDNYVRPSGCEIRFVADGPVELTLSGEVETEVWPFWGPYQRDGPLTVGREPTTLELAPPEALADLREAVASEYAFDPRVCRVLLPHRSKRLCYHDVSGEVRPPRPGELPGATVLAYGTSITRGIAATAPHLTYVARAATELGADALNLGAAGAAFCEPEIADHIAARDDWDAAVLAISVNMVAGFTVEEFRERATHMLDTVAGENPERPVLAVTLYPYVPDLCEDPDGHEDYESFRDVLRRAVSTSDHANLHLAEGPDLLPGGRGLTTDLVHPGDDAMIQIGHGLAAELEGLLG